MNKKKKISAFLKNLYTTYLRKNTTHNLEGGKYFQSKKIKVVENS